MPKGPQSILEGGWASQPAEGLVETVNQVNGGVRPCAHRSGGPSTQRLADR